MQRESSLLFSCEGEFRIALESLQRNQALFRAEVEFSVLLTCGRKLGFPLELWWDLGIPLEGQEESQDSSRVEVGKSCFL